MRAVVALFAVLAIAGCGSTSSKYDKTANWSAEQLYADAKAEISSGGWKEARERLTAIESRYPFGVYAQQALLELAYVNWKDGETSRPWPPSTASSSSTPTILAPTTRCT